MQLLGGVRKVPGCVLRHGLQRLELPRDWAGQEGAELAHSRRGESEEDSAKHGHRQRRKDLLEWVLHLTYFEGDCVQAREHLRGIWTHRYTEEGLVRCDRLLQRSQLDWKPQLTSAWNSEFDKGSLQEQREDYSQGLRRPYTKTDWLLSTMKHEMLPISSIICSQNESKRRKI